WIWPRSSVREVAASRSHAIGEPSALPKVRQPRRKNPIRRARPANPGLDQSKPITAEGMRAEYDRTPIWRDDFEFKPWTPPDLNWTWVWPFASILLALTVAPFP